jgi:hypothetical protein
MRSLLLVISLIWIGCGDGVDVDANAENVCSEIAKVACHNLYRCCSEGEIEDFLEVDEPRTEPQCTEDVRRLCERSIARLDAGIAARRVRFDSSIMNGCLQALVAPENACATVATTLPWAEECMNTAWVGLVADGAQCFATFECGSKDSFCAPTQTCTARPGNGQPCGVNGCATGHFCSAGTCRPQTGAGTPCTSSLGCLDPLFCDFSSVTPTCTELRDGGGACTSDAGCKSGDCIPGTCSGSTQTCFTSATCGRRCTNNGAACTQDSQCGVPGVCMGTTIACSTGNPCLGGETCVFPMVCQQTTCVGNPVCSTAQIVADYCTGAIGEIDDVFPPNN